MQNTPIYQGVTPTVAQAPRPDIQGLHPALAAHWRRKSAESSAALAGMSEAGQTFYNDIVWSRATVANGQLDSETDDALDRMLTGNPSAEDQEKYGDIWGKDGLTLNPSAINAIKNDYITRYIENGRNLIGEKSNTAYIERGAQSFANLEAAIARKSEAALLSKRKDAYEHEMDYYLKSGQLERALSLNDRGLEQGLKDPWQHASLQYDLEQERYLQEARSMDADHLLDAYDAGTFAGASEKTQRAIESLLRMQRDAASEQENTRYQKNAKGELTQTKTCPDGYPDYIVRVYDKHGGDFSHLSVADDIERQRAYARYCTQYTTTLEGEEAVTQEAHLRQTAKLMGVSESIAGKYIAAARSYIAPSGGKGRVSKTILNNKSYMPRALYTTAKEEEQLTALWNWLTGRQEKNETDDPKYADIEAEYKQLVSTIEARRNNINDSILARMSVENTEGMNYARYNETLTRIIGETLSEAQEELGLSEPLLGDGETVEELVGSGGKLSERLIKENKEREQALTQRYKENAALIANADETTRARRQERERSAAFASVSARQNTLRGSFALGSGASANKAALQLPGNKTDLLIYVPRGSGLAGGSVLITAPNNCSSEAQLIEQDVAQITLSQRLRRKLGCIIGQYNTINFQGVQAHLSSGSPAVPGGRSAAEIIYANEARQKGGKLQIYYPPAGDGGGAYEVAGINAASHPSMAARLKQLIQRGEHDRAEKLAKSYIADYTAPAADLATQAGIKSEAIAAYMQDIYFNGGAGGLAGVLNRALDLPSRAGRDQQREALKTYAETAGEAALLKRLKDARMDWYRSIATRNPSKKRFLSGWINRSIETYNALARN